MQIVIFTAATGTLQAQETATIRLRQPPPNQLRYSDLWEVDLLNPTRTTFTVRLVTTVRVNNNDGIVLTATSSTFSLPPGMRSITAATANQLSPVQTQYRVSRYRDAVTRTGEFPSGDYQICVTVNTNSVAANPVIESDCVDQHVESSVSPILLTPVNEATLEEPLPVFTWTWGGAGRPDVRMSYRMRIVEILGRQPAQAAMQRNLAWFEAENLRASVLQYPPGARALQAGHRYAWMVVVYTFNQVAGESEVWEFTYQPPKPSVPMSAKLNEKPVGVPIDVLQELLRSCSETP
jgi:hypothetical protein